MALAAQSDLSKRALRHRAELLASPPNIEAFQALGDECEKKKRRMVEELMSRVMRGESLDVMQHQVDYDRGWIDAMRYIVTAIPAGANRMLLRQLEQGSEAEAETDFWSYEEDA